MVKLCSIDGCGRSGKLRRGWCSMHYKRWSRHGDPLISSPLRGNDEARFWLWVNKDGPTPPAHTLAAIRGIITSCWIWTGGGDIEYGRIRLTGREKPKTIGAHRFSLTIHGVDLIDGLEVDHLCEVKNCCNPQHLEQVTHEVNVQRAIESQYRLAQLQKGLPILGRQEVHSLSSI